MTDLERAARAIVMAANLEQPLDDPGLEWVGIDAVLLRALAKALPPLKVRV